MLYTMLLTTCNHWMDEWLTVSWTTAKTTTKTTAKTANKTTAKIITSTTFILSSNYFCCWIFYDPQTHRQSGPLKFKCLNCKVKFMGRWCDVTWWNGMGWNGIMNAMDWYGIEWSGNKEGHYLLLNNFKC